jgi:hypothetical protein
MSTTVETFILRDKNLKISDIDNIDESLFVNIREYKSLNAKCLDFDYLEGAIIITHNGQKLLGLREWDLVEQLWGYFVDAIGTLRTEDDANFAFPDQPFEVSLTRRNNKSLSVGLNGKSFTAIASEFFMQMLDSSIEFYNNLLFLFPEHIHFINESLATAKEIRKDYKAKIF